MESAVANNKICANIVLHQMSNEKIEKHNKNHENIYMDKHNEHMTSKVNKKNIEAPVDIKDEVKKSVDKNINDKKLIVSSSAAITDADADTDTDTDADMEDEVKTLIKKIINKKLDNSSSDSDSGDDVVKKDTKKIKFIDLFCGIGSFHYSFKKNDWDCVMACDIAPASRKTYNENYGLMPLKDICEINPKDVENYDILCAGFPCQPFSQCGKHLGFDDERGTMFAQVMKFVKHHKPKVVILENVQGLLNHDDGKTFTKIQSDIKDANYVVVYKVLKCSDYGIPQMRKRLLIVGVRKDVRINGTMDDIFDLTKYEKNITLSKYMNKKFEKDTAYTIRCGGKRSPIDDKHNWDGYIVDNKEYRLTIEDALKLQGFPKDFKLCGTDSQKWKLLGNTIPTIFTEIIGKQINDIVSLV